MGGITLDPSMAVQQAQDQELVRFKVEMDSLKKQLAGGSAKEKQLKKACTDFEAVFIGRLWQEMKATVPKDGYLKSRQGEMYSSMFDHAFAEKMAENGGIGLADMLYNQLKKKLKNVSGQNLPGGTEIKPLDPEPTPIPLKRQQAAQPVQPAAAAPQAAERIVAAALADAAASGPAKDETTAQVEGLAKRIEAGQTRKIDWPSQSTGWRRSMLYGRNTNRGG